MQLFRVKCRNCKKVLFECSKEGLKDPNADKTVIVKICPKCKERNTYNF